MKNFFRKVRSLWVDIIKPLVAACCGPLRLVTKMYLAAVFAATSFCFVLVASAVLFQQGNRSDVLRWAIGFVAGCVVVSIIRFVEYERRLDEAWREKAWFYVMDSEEVRKMMEEDGYVYLQSDANLLIQLLKGAVPLENYEGHSRRALVVLEVRGWIEVYLAKRDERTLQTVRLTEKAWALFDELQPHGWSPEDKPQPVSAPSPA